MEKEQNFVVIETNNVCSKWRIDITAFFQAIYGEDLIITAIGVVDSYYNNYDKEQVQKAFEYLPRTLSMKRRYINFYNLNEIRIIFCNGKEMILEVENSEIAMSF